MGQGGAHGAVPVSFDPRTQRDPNGGYGELHAGVRTGVASTAPARTGLAVPGSMRRQSVHEHGGQNSDVSMHAEALRRQPRGDLLNQEERFGSGLRNEHSG